MFKTTIGLKFAVNGKHLTIRILRINAPDNQGLSS